MALRLDRVRLLIADDVGVGKTIEAGMIARELLDRGIAHRLCVLCPAHLCEQWERELRQKFAIEAAVVRPSTVARLERDLPRQDLSIYEHYSHLIASIDFIKAERHRGPFLRAAPDLVIVDEAHGSARPRGERERSQHQRHELLQALAGDRSRHLLLVTATPHSGIEESFRSLLGLLDPGFEQPSPGTTSDDRKRLLPHIIQRRRRDVEHWLGAETPFPERLAEETRYELGRDYLALYRDVLEYCRETVEAGAGLRAAQQRVRYWAAIALLRCLLSSPGSAQAVLSGRAQRLAEDEQRDESSPDEKDSAYRPQVADPLDDEEAGDYVPVAPFEDAEAAWTGAERRRLAGFMRRARTLEGPEADRKLEGLTRALTSLLRDRYRPVVFCRFIATANYLAAWLPKLLGKTFDGLEVRAVTGEVGDEERRERVEELVAHERRILVATDCLSEGINLQEHFDAVVHYDLPWNPNRLEQREGRVDRFGQPRAQVKTALLYGTNNEVDQVVLDVLLRKAHAIRNALGVSVPVPAEAERVVEAVVGSVLLRRPRPGLQMRARLHDPGGEPPA